MVSLKRSGVEAISHVLGDACEMLTPVDPLSYRNAPDRLCKEAVEFSALEGRLLCLKFWQIFLKIRKYWRRRAIDSKYMLTVVKKIQ